MATTTATITLSSSDLLSDALSLSVATSITASASTGLARRAVDSTSATPATDLFLYDASDWTAPGYLYIKNTDSTASNYVYVYADTTTDDPVILKIAGGAWAFLPADTEDLKAYGTSGSEVVEFMVIGTEA